MNQDHYATTTAGKVNHLPTSWGMVLAFFCKAVVYATALYLAISIGAWLDRVNAALRLMEVP